MKPTHLLKLRDPDTKYDTTVGAAWLQNGGHITILLNPGITLSYADQRRWKLQLTLFENDRDPSFIEEKK